MKETPHRRVECFRISTRRNIHPIFQAFLLVTHLLISKINQKELLELSSILGVRFSSLNPNYALTRTSPPISLSPSPSSTPSHSRPNISRLPKPEPSRSTTSYNLKRKPKQLEKRVNSDLLAVSWVWVWWGMMTVQIPGLLLVGRRARRNKRRVPKFRIESLETLWWNFNRFPLFLFWFRFDEGWVSKLFRRWGLTCQEQ